MTIKRSFAKEMEKKLEAGRRRMLLRAVLRERIEIAKSLRLFAASYRRSAKSYARQYAYSIAAEFAQRAEDFDRVANLVERR